MEVIEKNSLCLSMSRMSALKNVALGAALCESDAYTNQFHAEKFTELISFTIITHYTLSLISRSLFCGY